MVPTQGAGFFYTPVPATATCELPFSNAACMRSLTPFRLYAGMGFNFRTAGTNPDGGAPPPIVFDVSSYQGIRFWAKASDSGLQQLSVTFPDAPNYAGYGYSPCSQPNALQCGNYHQYTETLTSTWQPYEVDFTSLTQRLTQADGYYTTDHLDTANVIGIEFVESLVSRTPDGGLLPLDAGLDFSFDVCVAEITFLPK
jgi:hypothetical protein